MTRSAKWADLQVRVTSGLLLAGVGVTEVALGGWWFKALIVAASAVMLWELATMLGAEAVALAAGAAGAVALLLAEAIHGPVGLIVQLIAAAGVAALVKRDRTVGFAYAAAILLAASALMYFRDFFGGTWLFWLILVVIVTDVFGYFAGRLIGGPKFWPKVSPKKTWSGTIAGWVGAAAVGAVFLAVTKAGPALVWVSVLVSFASQMGDIAESAIKRRSGVKDSSRLIPGHGGLLDRFDGLMGAALMMLVLTLLLAAPVMRN
ncbi:MAG: phosphatidate cytidylyltransferase [Paracoccaceae bacterium]|nr:phosphatidate cytidylyltransferase [Paracoccaceae bacterium]